MAELGAVRFALKTLLRLSYLTFFKRKNFPHGRRLRFYLGFFATFLLAEPFNALCLLLDELLVPGWRRVRIQEPVFVIGNPRSGTTILHRVMAGDEKRFFYFRLWEIFYPSVVQKKILSGVGQLHRMAGSPLRALLSRLEARRFGFLRHIHQIGLFLPEEDDKLVLHILATADLVWFFPYGGFEKMARFDIAVDPRDQCRIMDFYLRCVRRQAYFTGGRRTFLSKNPAFSGKVANLIKYFPDCKLIYLVRNPLDVVPSFISLSRVIIRERLGVEPEAEMDEEAYELIKFYYTYSLDRISTMPEDRAIVVTYDDLIRQPKQVIQRIYKRFGFTLTPEFEERLDQEVAKMQRHQSRHEYAVDQYSVARERIVADLRPIFDRFAFDTREVTCSVPPTSQK